LLSASACYLSERMQQLLLDSKHRVGSGDEFDVARLIDMLNRRGAFARINSSDAMEEMRSMGIGEEAWPITAYLFAVVPIMTTIEKLWAGCPNNVLDRLKGCAYSFIKTKDA